MALLYEELGDGSNPLNLQSTYRVHRQPVLPPPLPLPPTKWVSRSVEAKKQSKNLRPNSDDRWTSLEAYRKAKGLCYVCGERWGRDHQCKGTVPLHLVQEMLDCMQLEDEVTCPDEEPVPEQLLQLLAATVGASLNSHKTMLLSVVVQGQPLSFLIDFGSSLCFLDQSKAHLFEGRQQLPQRLRVQVARGEIPHSTDNFPSLVWTAAGHEFTDCFRVLPLQSYDGILGHN
jgi:hypothetical protein